RYISSSAHHQDLHSFPTRRSSDLEVKEVLINLLENARNGGARRVTVRISDGGSGLAVEDDGRGIAADVLPRVFDPAFSTTSSGRSEEHTSELQSRSDLVCRLLLEK